MSNNYIWFSETNMIQCTSFKAAYQLCRQMYRHNFFCINEAELANTRLFLLHKCNTDIIIYVYNELRDPLSNKVVSYSSYINSLRRNRK